MKSIGFGLICLAAATVTSTAPAQQADLGDTALAPEIELPPRYRVEFIIFAHNRLDPAEEHFDIVPAASQFAAPEAPIPQRIYDEASSAALRELIEAPIVPPPPAAPVPEDSVTDPGQLADTALPQDELTQPELEAWVDPRLIDGPATRYLNLDELTLLPTLDRLDRLDAYTPLVHGGWEQNGLPEAEAVPLELAEFDSTNPRGTIRLHMSRFLHISVDIAYREEPRVTEPEPSAGIPRFGDPSFPQPRPISPFGFGNERFAPEPELPEYFLLEQRRILRDELNYFDHPAFGLLLKITLAPEPEDETETQTDGPSA